MKISTTPFLILLLVSKIFCSCSGGYEQNYTSFYEYDTANVRNKSWFPDILRQDAYDIRSVSYLDKLCCFGCFRYTDKVRYDSMFIQTELSNSHFEVFLQKIRASKIRKPGWFYDPESKKGRVPEMIKMDQFYIARDTGKSTIYFVLAN